MGFGSLKIEIGNLTDGFKLIYQSTKNIMRKLLFLVFFGCLSANAWAQSDAIQAIYAFAKHHANRVQRADSIKKNTYTPIAVFYAEKDNQGDYIQNAVIWDRKTHLIAIKNIKKSDFSGENVHNYTRFICFRLEKDTLNSKTNLFCDKLGHYAQESNGIESIEKEYWEKECPDVALTERGDGSFVWTLKNTKTDMPQKLLMTVRQENNKCVVIDDENSKENLWWLLYQ
jgi:hypothetical protein